MLFAFFGWGAGSRAQTPTRNLLRKFRPPHKGEVKSTVHRCDGSQIAYANVSRRLVTHDAASDGVRAIPEEIAVAFTYGSATFAVMMATPEDVEDHAIGFSLTEGIIDSASEIEAIEIVPHEQGVEARMILNEKRDKQLLSRRRRLAGPGGCGLCGIESLEAAVAPVRAVNAALLVDPPTIFAALRALRSGQQLNAATHAVHAAGFWSVAQNRLVALREDVGRTMRSTNSPARWRVLA